MTSRDAAVFLVVLALVTGCGDKPAPKSSDAGTPSPSGPGSGGAPSGDNVLSVTVNGALCASDSYANKPCVSVTLCAPGTSSCQTIDDILLDTGSFGIRVFKQVLSITLPAERSGLGVLAECVQYGDGSEQWGPVESATVILGGEPGVEVPVQIVDSKFATSPPACANADQDPRSAGFNGILGIGLFAEDCGAACQKSAGIGIYYSCIGSSCAGTTVPISDQVRNPVSALPQDNNGVVVELPSVPLGGSRVANGYLILGIGSRSNNAPSAVKTYTTNASGELSTTLDGASYPSFIDTGSNGLFFPSPSSSQLPSCASPYSAWYCPASTVSLSATNTAVDSESGAVPFQIGNFSSLAFSSNDVFPDIGGALPFAGFDWGLPFFMGRNVYVGLAGTASTLGRGPYFAY